MIFKRIICLSLAIFAATIAETGAKVRKVEIGNSKVAAEKLSVPSPPMPRQDQGLMLSPLIKQGQIKEARKLAAVPAFTGSLQSYSGFVTVDDATNANLFFWMFLTSKNQGQAPLVLWLQGGPGGSSLFGLFVENGPYIVDAKTEVTLRNTSWTTLFNVIYIDNPVGTGFSFVDDEKGLRHDEDGVADHLYKFFVQFYAMFPELRQMPFFLSGESYAGKYVPAFGAKLAKMEKTFRASGLTNPVAKLSGILVGNGLSDPQTMFSVSGDHLYQLGLLNAAQRDYFNTQTSQAVEFMKQSEFRKAFEIFDFLINADFYPYPSYFQNASGCTDYFNFLLCKQSPPEFGYYGKFLSLNSTRNSIHVGQRPYGSQSQKVEAALIDQDIMNTVRDRVEYLLSQTSVPVLYYSGHLDLIVPTTGTEKFLSSLDWPKMGDWEKAQRRIWTDGEGEAAAYSTTVGQLTFVIMRNAGHMVPYDQPKNTLVMVSKFIAAVTHSKL